MRQWCPPSLLHHFISSLRHPHTQTHVTERWQTVRDFRPKQNGFSTFYDNLFDYFLVKVQTLSSFFLSWFFFYVLLYFALNFLFAVVSLAGKSLCFIWCNRRKRKCCSAYATERSCPAYVRVSLHVYSPALLCVCVCVTPINLLHIFCTI